MQPYSHRAVLILYGITATLLYAKSLGYQMVFDDLLYLAENPLFTDFQNFLDLFTQFSSKVVCLAPLGKDGDVSANFALRPLTYFSFFLNHSIGGLNTTGYRALNVLIHCTNAFLTFRLSLILLGAPMFGRQDDQAFKHIAAVGTGLFFLVHPLQTESVTYIIQRATSLSATFYLLAIVLHLECRESPGSTARAATFFSALCAMLSKESGVSTISCGASRVDCSSDATADGTQTRSPAFHSHARRAIDADCSQHASEGILWNSRFASCLSYRG